MISWRDDNWIEAGARVRLLPHDGRELGDWISGHGDPSDLSYLCVGARGIVIRSARGGAPPYACPDHHLGPDDCCCGDEDGVIPATLPTALVKWELDDGTTLTQLLRYPGDGGRPWELVELSDWHLECTLTPIQDGDER